MITSKRIHILIEILKETEISNEKYNSVTSSNSESKNKNAILEMIYNATETVAEKNNSTSHHVERVLNDVIVNEDMRLNIVHFCNKIIEWLITGDKSVIKEVLIKNVSETTHDSDLQAIEKWYNEK
ncbi:MAG: hypothetical protein K2L10_11615 [Ruminococcus sp.]|nr:hypothetical protein [Ruminococcus sp.]